MLDEEFSNEAAELFVTDTLRARAHEALRGGK
jgi:hypothetical protein